MGETGGRRIERAGGEVRLGARVVRVVSEGARVLVAATDGAEVRARALVNCAGLHSDRVLALAGGNREARIVPFRGEYFELRPEAAHVCRNLIYPVPDANFPFLGVHFTRLVHEAEHGAVVHVLDLAKTIGITKFAIAVEKN